MFWSLVSFTQHFRRESLLWHQTFNICPTLGVATDTKSKPNQTHTEWEAFSLTSPGCESDPKTPTIYWKVLLGLIENKRFWVLYTKPSFREAWQEPTLERILVLFFLYIAFCWFFLFLALERNRQDSARSLHSWEQMIPVLRSVATAELVWTPFSYWLLLTVVWRTANLCGMHQVSEK